MKSRDEPTSKLTEPHVEHVLRVLSHFMDLAGGVPLVLDTVNGDDISHWGKLPGVLEESTSTVSPYLAVRYMRTKKTNDCVAAILL